MGIIGGLSRSLHALVDHTSLPGVTPGQRDLITGNDSTFNASLGSWTNTGGTLARETSLYNVPPSGGNLQLTTTTSFSQYVELTIPGTFKAGKEYQALVLLKHEHSAASTISYMVSFGLIGTDATTDVQGTAGEDFACQNVQGFYLPFLARWRPTADRTGVKIRLTMGANTGTMVWHVGLVRVVEIANLGDAGLAVAVAPYHTGAGNQSDLQLAGYGGISTIHYGGYEGSFAACLQLARRWASISVDQANNSQAGVQMEADLVSPEFVWSEIWTKHTAGDITDGVVNAGLDIEVGHDFVGFLMQEKNGPGTTTEDGRSIDGTLQFYADYGDYDFEFADGIDNPTSQGSQAGHGRWRSRSAANVYKNFADMEARKGSGTATVASGTTAIVVTHAAGYTPSVNDVVVTPTNNPTNDPGWYWISALGSTTFTINVRSDPGAGGATFAWRVDR